MINKIVFLNDHLILPGLFGAIILIAAFIWKEWAQAGRRRIFFKISLVLLLICSLLLIALKPSLPSAENSGKFVLLTEAYNEDQLDSLQQEHTELQVVTYKPGKPVNKFISAEKIFVLGHGLKEYDLWQMDQIPTIYIGGSIPEGVIKSNFTKEHKVGDSLIFKGLYKHPRSGNRIVLQGPGGAGLDSLVFNSEEDQEFQLSAELKVPGNFVYSLAEKDSLGEILNSNPLPAKITENVNLRILIVNNFPTFETKYLKNFLAEAGHELVVQSQISRGRFKFEYFNTSHTTSGSLSKTSLEPFDLLIIDAASLRNLSPGQITEVENSVREDGLGVFIQPDDVFFRSPGGLVNFNFDRVQASEISFSHWLGISVDRHPFSIEAKNGLQIIHTHNDQVISGYKRKEQGRIGTTVFSTTWKLLLEGNPEVYRNLWTQIIEQVSKKQDPLAEWKQESVIIYPHEPFNFTLRTAVAAPVLRNGGGNLIPIKQDVNIPTLWTGTTWPIETGWNLVQLDTTTTFDYYVYPEDSWNSLTALKTIEVNQRYFNRDKNSGQGEKPLKPINPLWFYGLFLMGMGGLWLEPKV